MLWLPVHYETMTSLNSPVALSEMLSRLDRSADSSEGISPSLRAYLKGLAITTQQLLSES